MKCSVNGGLSYQRDQRDCVVMRTLEQYLFGVRELGLHTPVLVGPWMLAALGGNEILVFSLGIDPTSRCLTRERAASSPGQGLDSTSQSPHTE